MTLARFAGALLDPDAPIPAGVTGPDGLPDVKRFDVYRNNVASSLTRSLEAGFPVLRKLVGDEFFGAMAVVFLRAHPPRNRQLALYGADFPEFLAQFPPVAHLGYLPDVARLEQTLRDSYHAADGAGVPLEALTSLTEAQLLQARIGLAPSLRVLRSDWPIFSIWAANTQGGPAPMMQSQDVVILRPDYDPEPHLLPPGGAAFLTTLQADKPLIEALAVTGEGFDLSHILGLLLQGRAIVRINPWPSFIPPFPD